MAITGIVTNKGLAEAVKASSNQGWSIFPTRFGISAQDGELSAKRTDTNVTWYDAHITDQTVVSENTIQFVCTIPPQVTETDQHIKEIYLFGENPDEGSEFLLAIGHPSDNVTYFKDGSITLRMHVTLANIQASQVFEFKYTGHRSIEEHNTDATAHQELFGTLTDQIKALGETILVDGQLASGGSMYIDRATGRCKVDSARFYHKGVLYTVPAGEVIIPLSGVMGVGVWLSTDTDTQEKTLKWGTRHQSAGTRYYEIHVVEDGYLKTVVKGEIVQEPVSSAIVRYDRDANGSYVVNGLKATITETDDSSYVIQVSEGKAHIDGTEIKQHKTVEIKEYFDPDTAPVAAERHTFKPDAKGIMSVSLFEQPVATDKPIRVDYTKQQVFRVLRGQFSATRDFVVENPTKIIAVYGDGRQYREGVHFDISGSFIDWSRSGTQAPTMDEHYFIEVQFTKTKTVPTNDISAAGFTLQDAVEDSHFLVSYETLLPRKDLVILNRTGQIERVKGKGDTRSLTTPAVPAGALQLAEIRHHWTAGVNPQIEDSGVVALKASELNEMRNHISQLFDMLAVERVERLANSDDPRTTKGMFVDPFISDDYRDGGATQTAMVDAQNQELTLAFDVNTIDTKSISQEDAPQGLACLPYTLKEIVSQNASTGIMKVNPYAAFDPIPPKLTISPAIDNWTVQTNLRTSISRTVIASRQRMRASDFRQRFGSGSVATVTNSRNVSSSTTMRVEDLPNLRSLRVSFDLQGFKPGEAVRNIRFGSKDVTDSIGEYGLPAVDKTLLIGDNRRLDTRPLFEGAQHAILNWERSNPSTNGQVGNESSAWSVSNGHLQYRFNSTSWAMLLSTNTFDNFDVTARFTGLDNDNDRMGIIIARIKVDGKEHTLSAVRNQDKGENDLRWAIIKDYRSADATEISRSKNTDVRNNNGAAWSAFPEGMLVRVRRQGDIIECWTSEAGESELKASSKYLIDLSKDSRLAVFRRPCSWGLGSFSQQNRAEVISHTNHGNLG